MPIEDPVLLALMEAIDESASPLRLVAVTVLQVTPLLVSVNGAGSVQAYKQAGTTELTEGETGYALWSPPSMPIWFGGDGSGGGYKSGLFGTGVDQSGTNANAGGLNTTATGDNSLAVGEGSVASGYASTAENNGNATGDWAHAEGGSAASAAYAHAEGYSSVASEGWAHAEGFQTNATGSAAHSEGRDTLAEGEYSHAEGRDSRANGEGAHAEGSDTIADADWSHAEGDDTRALGEASHSEGYNTEATENYAHSEGEDTVASGRAAHAEGGNTTASDQNAHAEGAYTVASGASSHAEGDYSQAVGPGAHAEGTDSWAIGEYSHAGGWSVIAFRDQEFARGVPANIGSSATLQHAKWPLANNNGPGLVNMNDGTDPVIIPVHDGCFDGTLTLYLHTPSNFTDKYVIGFWGTNDAADYANRDTGTVTIDGSSGGAAAVFGSSGIVWTVSGDNAGNVVFTPDSSTGALRRFGVMEITELHDYLPTP